MPQSLNKAFAGAESVLWVVPPSQGGQIYEDSSPPTVEQEDRRTQRPL